MNLEPQGYLVKANDKVSLLFGMDGTFSGPAIVLPNGGFAVFDELGTWTEYMIDHGHGGYLRFSPDGQWLGVAA